MEDPSVFKTMVKKHTDTLRTIRSRFSQIKELSMMEDRMVSSGKLYYEKPDKVRWEYLDPFQHLILIRGEEMIVKGEDKKDRYDMGSNEMFRKMNELLVSSVNGKIFEKEDFERAYYQDENEYLAVLTPKEKSMKEFFQRILLYFSKTGKEVVKVEMVEGSGDSTTIEFKKKRINVPLPEDTFMLDP